MKRKAAAAVVTDIWDHIREVVIPMALIYVGYAAQVLSDIYEEEYGYPSALGGFLVTGMAWIAAALRLHTTWRNWKIERKIRIEMEMLEEAEAKKRRELIEQRERLESYKDALVNARTQDEIYEILEQNRNEKTDE